MGFSNWIWNIGVEFHLANEKDFWTATLILSVACLCLFAIRIIINGYIVEKYTSGGVEPNYGLIAQPIVLMLWRFAFILVVIQLLLGFAYAFGIGEHDIDHQWMANVFISTISIIWPLIFSGFVIALLLNNILPPPINADMIRSRIRTGKEHVLVAGCYRGKLLNLVGRELSLKSKQANSPLGSITVIDPWKTEKLPLDETWALENLRRSSFASGLFRPLIEGQRVRILSRFAEGHSDYPHLCEAKSFLELHNLNHLVVDQYADMRAVPLADESVDLVVLGSIGFIYGDEWAEDVADEAFRVLKKGGKVIYSRVWNGDLLEQRLKELGVCNFEAQKRITLPFVSTVITAEKPRNYTPQPEEDPMKMDNPIPPIALQPLKYPFTPFDTIYTPIRSEEDAPMATGKKLGLLFMVSLLFLVLIVISSLGLYLVWPKTDFPKKIAPDNYSRVSSGFLAPSVMWIAFAFCDVTFQLKEECDQLRITTTSQFFKRVAYWLAISVIGTVAWNGLWWIPSLIVDLYFAKQLKSIMPVSIINILISVALLVVGLKGYQFLKRHQSHENRIARMEMRTSERTPLITHSSINHVA